MSSAAPTAERRVSWSAAGEGERLWFLGTLAIVRAPAEAAGGCLCVLEFLFPRHAAPPLHTDPQDESYVVLDGRLTVAADCVGSALPASVSHACKVASRVRPNSRRTKSGPAFSSGRQHVSLRARPSW